MLWQCLNTIGAILKESFIDTTFILISQKMLVSKETAYSFTDSAWHYGMASELHWENNRFIEVIYILLNLQMCWSVLWMMT